MKYKRVIAMGDIIGLDIGTSSIKGIRISQDGKRKVMGKEEFVYRIGPKGQVEIDAEKYLTACCRLLRRFCSAGEEKILAVCAASASGNLLLLDQQGAPCTPILNWQDARVEEEARRILSGFDPQKLYEAIGWPFDWKTFPLAQLCYLKCHRPELLKQSSMICMSTEYLYWRLCGKWGISPSAGTPFYLLDQRSGQYYPALLDQLGIGEEKLPPVQKAGSCIGCVTQQGAALSGLEPGTPLILGTFDHPSAARGAGVFEQEQMLLSCGTYLGGVFIRWKIGRRQSIAACWWNPFRQPEGCWVSHGFHFFYFAANRDVYPPLCGKRRGQISAACLFGRGKCAGSGGTEAQSAAGPPRRDGSRIFQEAYCPGNYGRCSGVIN